MNQAVNPFAQPASAPVTQPFTPVQTQPVSDAQFTEVAATPAPAAVQQVAQAVVEAAPAPTAAPAVDPAAVAAQQAAEQAAALAAQQAAAQQAAQAAAQQAAAQQAAQLAAQQQAQAQAAQAAQAAPALAPAPAQLFGGAGTAVATATPFGAPVVAAAPAPMGEVPMGGMAEVSFDTDIKFNKLDKFAKMKKDEIARIAFLLAQPNGQPRLRMSHVFYDDATKRSYLAPEDKAVYAKFMEKFGEPKIRFATIVAVYHTDLAGNPQSQSIRLQAFVFGQDKFPDLKQLHKNWNLLSRDLMIQCKEESFQKMTYSPTPDSWIGAVPQIAAEKVAEATELFGKPLDFFLGRKLNPTEIGAILGLAGAMPAAGAPSYNPFGAAPAAGAPQLAAPAASPFGAAPAAAGVGAAPGANAFADLVVQGTNAG